MAASSPTGRCGRCRTGTSTRSAVLLVVADNYGTKSDEYTSRLTAGKRRLAPVCGHGRQSASAASSTGYGRGTGPPPALVFNPICAGRRGADDGNRTRVFSLGSRFDPFGRVRQRPPESDGDAWNLALTCSDSSTRLYVRPPPSVGVWPVSFGWVVSLSCHREVYCSAPPVGELIDARH